MTEQIISIIVAVVLVIGAGLLIYFRYKNSPKEEDKIAARNFLDGFKDILYNRCVDFIKNFDYKKYDNLADIEIDIINSIINDCKEYISEELKKSTDILSVLTIKALNSDFIEKYIFELLDHIDVFDKIDKCASAVNDDQDNSSDEDEELAKEFSDTTKYNDEEMEKLPEAEEIKYTDEELSKLNPQKDEEESYNPEDESMEIIEEVKNDDDKPNTIIDTDDIYIDASGRARSTSTGKFVKKNSII